MPTKSTLLSYRDLSNERIQELGLSFRDIGQRCNNIIQKYLLNNLKNATPNEVMISQKKLRRILSNLVNDPKNVVNYKGSYIGKRYGARITIIRTDGLVLHDVETFCRDVRNRNNRILGNNNNYVFIRNDSALPQFQNVFDPFLYSTLNVNDVLNSTIQYTNQNAYKVKSSSVPSSDPNSSVMKYVEMEASDGNNVTISSGEFMDLHTLRKECIQAAAGRYGYASRVSKTINSINYYVCKNVEDDDGRSVLVRLSYFEYPPENILDVLAKTGRFQLLLLALKATDLIPEFLPSSGLPKPNLTLFAPTDKAFIDITGLPEDEGRQAIEQILQDPENKPALRLLLKYHVTPDISPLRDNSFVTTMADLSIYARRDPLDGIFAVQNAKVVATIRAQNSVIYEIDQVLDTPSIFDMLTLIPQVSKFADLIEEGVGSDLRNQLADDTEQLTLLAPTDQAFEPFVGQPFAGQEERLLNQHLIDSFVPFSLEDFLSRANEEENPEEGYAPILSRAGEEIKLEPTTTTSASSVIINQRAAILLPDIRCTNGILHIVSTFIAPFPVTE